MLLRNYSTGPRFWLQFLPIFWRVVVRSVFGTHWRAQLAMARVSLRRAWVWLPTALADRARGVKSPVTLQVVDDIGCRAGCSNCVFTAFEVRGTRLSLEDLDRMFTQALEMNVTNIYLMGADPFYRADAKEMIALLARHKYQLVFLFTEGKRVKAEHLDQLRAAGNIFPVLNIDGLREAEDDRKGEGSFATVEALLDRLQSAQMPYFVTTMIGKKNYAEVTGEDYVRWLDAHGAWLLAYVPYAPVDAKAEADMVMDPELKRALFPRSLELNRAVKRTVILDLLGIEEELTSCPAGVYTMTVFHDGTAVPCPAIPFGRAEDNVRSRTLQEIFFDGHLYRALRANHEGKRKVSCMFFTDPEFLNGYVTAHRPALKILNPSAMPILAAEGTGRAERLRVLASERGEA